MSNPWHPQDNPDPGVLGWILLIVVFLAFLGGLAAFGFGLAWLVDTVT